MKNHYTRLYLLGFSIVLLSCGNPNQSNQTIPDEQAKATITNSGCRDYLNEFMQSINDKDLEKMESMLDPDHELQLILAGRELTYSKEAFVDLHRAWFKDTTWTMETEILTLEENGTFAAATTRQKYREPNRNGEPYFNDLVVAYVLKKVNGKWTVIKDQASSFKKSTD